MEKDLMNWIEITTKIGCKNMCSYCPQTKFLKEYKDTKKLMSLDDFKFFLSKINKKETKIHFSGFSESFLNDDSVDMMIHAYDNGFGVILYTTLVGFTLEKATKLKESGMIFEQTRMHEFDGVGFNRETFNNSEIMFRENVKSLDHRIVRVDNPMSRGGSLFDVQHKHGKIRCAENRYFDNVLLPNGDLYMCCSDWLLKHKIGNLYEDGYSSEKINESRVKNIKLCDSYDSDVICRDCEWSYNV